jgi:hypothetical protein
VHSAGEVALARGRSMIPYIHDLLLPLIYF